jgi:hypothetical protein
MGFLDKAKKLAEQAQTKLDEVQGQFNQQQAGTSSGPITEYDKHGRPIPPAGADAAATMGSVPPPAPPAPPEAAATPGVPATGSPATAPVEAAPSAPPPLPTPGASAAATSAQREAVAPEEDRNFPSHAPPTLTSGDPLAG